ncbi:hypothetical protein [Novosphingobium album (ex Liu et al. 2023)]|uniref:Uncharacterized protein n=1 Tax=Novosphingobium album (ex Liu et al. 2023) TaxID=3031130 RepID=A0ABT5WN19_9SPHN|nr:hypothetical protein [Novosphingobium album (ex Liu et al. 2023)]MDE8651435.1 hypothetical protein [Novosphingobium album (ex Liu et al. 2023)]
MSAPGQSDSERQLAERLKQFYERPESIAVAHRHMLWRETVAGHVTMAKLNSLAVLRVQALVTQHDYEVAVHELATENVIPLADMRILAEGAYEARRCYYLAAELIPIALGDWYPAGETNCGN